MFCFCDQNNKAMSEMFHAPVLISGDLPGIRAGQKRSLPSSSDCIAEDYPSKRGSGSSFYTTYWPESNTDNSPKTPESGIDMNDLGCSPPCYSVTRTTPQLFESAADVPTMLTVAVEPQADQCKDGFFLCIVDEPEEVSIGN